MQRHFWCLVATSALALLSAESSAQVTPTPVHSAVNGTTIQCPRQDPPGPDQLAAWFETRPLDLDALSQKVNAMMASNSPAAASMRAKQIEQRANDWPLLCRYRDENAMIAKAGKHPRVIFMGDSITERWVQANPDFFGRHDYLDRGISGQSSSQMVARFYQDVVTLAPRAVHIMAGTNDIGGATGPITEEDYISNIRAMLDLARANHIAVVLAGLPPMSRLLPRPEFDVGPWIKRLNFRLRQLAQERGVEFVDYYGPLAAPDGTFDPRFANDGVHPTRAGYAVMEPLAEAAIARALRSMPAGPQTQAPPTADAAFNSRR